MKAGAHLLLFVGLTCLALPCAEADVVLKVDERTVMSQTLAGEESVETLESTVFVASDRARADRGEDSLILREDLGKLWIVHHPSRAYQEIDLPVQLEAYVPKESRATVDELLAFLAANTEIERSGETDHVGPWSTQRWQAHVVFPLAGSADEYEFWLTTDIEYDLGAYEALVQAVNALDPRTRSWYGQVIDLDGIVVRSEARRGSGQSLKVTATRRLHTTITEKDFTAALYEVPEDYRRVPFRFDAEVKGPVSPGRPRAE